MAERIPKIIVPFNDLVAQYKRIKPEIDAAIQQVIQTGTFVGGKEVVNFESEFAKYCSAADCVGVANGTDAIELALKALDVGPGDEVVLPAMTFVATAEAVIAVGANPVIADIDPTTYTLSADAAEAAISTRTKCILTVHLYGLISDMPSLRNLADRYGLFLIEDAAQSHGALCGGKPVGWLGDIATFSFYPGKNFGAYGDGGAVISKNTALIERIRSLQNHGRKAGEKYLHSAVGRNSRLDNLQAAILRVKLKHLDEWNKTRRAIADKYHAGLESRFTTPYVPPSHEHVYHIFCLRVTEREHVIASLKENDITTGLHYPVPIHRQPAYSKMQGLAILPCPVADALAETCLSLPIFPEMSQAQVEKVLCALQDLPSQNGLVEY